VRLIMITAALLGFVASASAETRSTRKPRIEMVTLGTMYPGGSSSASAVNDRGVVAGVHYRDSSSNLENSVAFLWTRSNGFVAIVENAYPIAINNRNEVIGIRAHCGIFCVTRAFFWSEKDGLWDFPDYFSPVAINNKGQVAGSCVPGYEPIDEDGVRACIMVDRMLTIVATMPSAHMSVTDINDRGELSGNYERWDSNETGLFITNKQGDIRILNLDDDAVGGRINAINSRGVAVGVTYVPPVVYSSAETDATVWSGSQPIALRSAYSTVAVDINNANWVVGYAKKRLRPLGAGPVKPILWTSKHGVVRLPIPEGYSGLPSAINNSGQIVGNIYNASGGMAVIWRVRP
jgi:hypothetical protein